MFQVCERRKHQLVESHISCYCVQKTVNATAGVPYQLRTMSLDVIFNQFRIISSILMINLAAFYCYSFLLWLYENLLLL